MNSGATLWTRLFNLQKRSIATALTGDATANYSLLTSSATAQTQTSQTESSFDLNSASNAANVNYYYNPTYGQCAQRPTDAPPPPPTERSCGRAEERSHHHHKSRSLPPIRTAAVADSSDKSTMMKGRSSDEHFSGFLYRLEGSAIKSWKRRWAVLSGSIGQLSFYKQDGGLLLDSLPVGPGTGYTVTEDGRKAQAFRLENPHLKTSLYLATETPEERAKWVAVLKRQVVALGHNSESNHRQSHNHNSGAQRREDDNNNDDESGFSTYQGRRALTQQQQNQNGLSSAGPVAGNGYANAPPKPRRSNPLYSSIGYPPDIIAAATQHAHNNSIYSGANSGHLVSSNQLNVGLYGSTPGATSNGYALRPHPAPTLSAFPPLPPRPSSVENYIDGLHTQNGGNSHGHHPADHYAHHVGQHVNHYLIQEPNDLGMSGTSNGSSSSSAKSPRPKSSLAAQQHYHPNNIAIGNNGGVGGVNIINNNINQINNSINNGTYVSSQGPVPRGQLSIKPWSEYLIGASQATPAVTLHKGSVAATVMGTSTYSQLRNFSSATTATSAAQITAVSSTNQIANGFANGSGQNANGGMHPAREESLQRLLDWKDKMLAGSGSGAHGHLAPSRPPLPHAYNNYSLSRVGGGGGGRNNVGRSGGRINASHAAASEFVQMRERSKSIGDYIGTAVLNEAGVGGQGSSYFERASAQKRLDCYSSDDEEESGCEVLANRRRRRSHGRAHGGLSRAARDPRDIMAATGSADDLLKDGGNNSHSYHIVDGALVPTLGAKDPRLSLSAGEFIGKTMDELAFLRSGTGAKSEEGANLYEIQSRLDLVEKKLIQLINLIH